MTNSEVVNDVLWTEKYRPQSLDEMAMEPENRNILQKYIDEGVIPHMLFIGPPGSGKTTISRILIKGLNCVVLPLNASSERGIDVVRGKIGSFVGALSRARWNIVFLDEADQMTPEAQGTMRNMIEAYSERARFILTANYGHKIIQPIHSRCQVLHFGRPPVKERVKILLKVLKSEGVDANPQMALGYAERYPDLRQMLWAAQRAYLGNKSNGLPPANESGPITGEELLKHLLNKQWNVFTGYTRSPDFDCTQGLREMFHAVPDEHPQAFRLRRLLGRGVHEASFTPDPIVLFLAVMAEIME